MGVCRDASRDNWVVMVPFVVPGEQVRVRVFRNYANYSDADLVEVLKPRRIVLSRCGLFQACGGCQYQHMDYQRQLKEKTAHVKELMEKIGEIDFPVDLAIGSPVYHYRSKSPHYNRPNKDGSQPIGFLQYSRHNQIIDVEQCPIATTAINEALPEAREEARASGGKKRRQRGGTLLLRDVLEGVVTNPKEIVSERVGDLTFSSSGRVLQTILLFSRTWWRMLSAKRLRWALAIWSTRIAVPVCSRFRPRTLSSRWPALKSVPRRCFGRRQTVESVALRMPVSLSVRRRRSLMASNFQPRKPRW